MLKQKVAQHAQFREATMQIEDYEPLSYSHASSRAVSIDGGNSGKETPVGQEEEVAGVGCGRLLVITSEAALSSDEEGSIGDTDDVGINQRVLTRA